MPIVGKKKFSYTRKGLAEAKAEAKKTGKGISMKKGYKKGGVAKKKAGGAAKKMQRGGPSSRRSELTHMASGEPIKWQSGPTGRRRRADYMSYVATKVARKQLKKQAAAGGPGRRAVRGAGGAKAGGAIKKMQAGGLSQAQQNLLRGAQEHAARSGQNPARLQSLTAQHGNLYNQRQQRRAQSQMAGNQPGRSAMRGIGPGMKKGGKVSNRSGFNLYGYRKGGSVKKK